MTPMRISEFAERSGVPASTLRFYEGAGLLPADRSPAGYRMYGEDALERLAFIGSAKRLGLPLEEIGALLAVWAGGACREVKADLRPRVVARLDEAERRKAELAALIGTLHGALDRLDELPDRDEPCDANCGSLTRPAAVAHDAERWRTAPVACSLAGEDVAERMDAWRAVLGGAARTPIPDGIRLTLPAERAAAVAGLAAAEQRCCPFFGFGIQLDGPRLHLDVRATAEGAGLLAELFGPVA